MKQRRSAQSQPHDAAHRYADPYAYAQQSDTPRHRYRLAKVCSALVLLGVLAMAGRYGVRVAGTALTRLHGTHAAAAPVAPRQRSSQAAMSQGINAVIAANNNVDIAVVCIDLKTGAAYTYGVADGFEAASVGKLITATDYLHSVENGQVSLSDDLSETDSNGDINAGKELEAMVVNSDNDAWQALNDYLGADSLHAYAAQNGINNYQPDTNVLTAADVAGLLQKLYKGQLLASANTKLLLGYMAQANEADYIPPVVPAGVRVYHKAGLLDDRIHDAAIIDDGQNSFVLVVMTNGHGTYDTAARQAAIQTIAKAAVAHFIGN